MIYIEGYFNCLSLKTSKCWNICAREKCFFPLCIFKDKWLRLKNPSLNWLSAVRLNKYREARIYLVLGVYHIFSECIKWCGEASWKWSFPPSLMFFGACCENEEWMSDDKPNAKRRGNQHPSASCRQPHNCFPKFPQHILHCSVRETVSWKHQMIPFIYSIKKNSGRGMHNSKRRAT